MPERRRFRGKLVKTAKLIVGRDKRPMIKIIFAGAKGRPGQQLLVDPEMYDKEVERFFEPGSSAK